MFPPCLAINISPGGAENAEREMLWCRSIRLEGEPGRCSLTLQDGSLPIMEIYSCFWGVPEGRICVRGLKLGPAQPKDPSQPGLGR